MQKKACPCLRLILSTAMTNKLTHKPNSMDYSISEAPDLDILATFRGNSSRVFNDDALVEWVKNLDVDYHFSL